ncbi:MAG: hypothetical protein AAF085_05430 [Planctomycetota bacterium]
MDEEHAYHTAQELMERWRIKRAAFYANIQRGNIPKGEKIGGRVLWSAERVKAYEDKAKREAEK